MRLLIASDIHGSSYWCEKLMTAFEEEKADKLLLLGDLLYHGPRNELPKGYDPKKVFEMLNAKKDVILCVRGNCDADVDQMVLEFPITQETLILELDGNLLYATHGHKENEAHPPKITGEYYLLNGHFHVTTFAQKEGFTYVNPGSISLPKDGSGHTYMVYENGVFEVKEL